MNKTLKPFKAVKGWCVVDANGYPRFWTTAGTRKDTRNLFMRELLPEDRDWSIWQKKGYTIRKCELKPA